MSDTNSTDSTSGGGNGSVGATAYYGGIAVALCIIIFLTLVSRFIYKRRARQRLQQANRAERLTLQERGEAPGLPTYNESRRGPSLPHYTVDYQPPPNGQAGPYPPPQHPPPESGNHFHFHFPPLNMPSLPQAMHLRPQRADEADVDAVIPSQPPPAYKYEPPAGTPPPPPPNVASNQTSEPDSTTNNVVTQGQEMGERGANGTGLGPVSSPTLATSQDQSALSSEERERLQQEELDREERERQITHDYNEHSFIHPEERRRQEAAGDHL